MLITALSSASIEDVKTNPWVPPRSGLDETDGDV
jgi:hypothetical protein